MLQELDLVSIEDLRKINFIVSISKSVHLDLRSLKRHKKLNKNKSSMIKISESLNVFDADKHDLDSPANMRSFKNGAAHKSDSKRGSSIKRKSRLRITRNKIGVPSGSYCKSILT